MNSNNNNKKNNHQRIRTASKTTASPNFIRMSGGSPQIQNDGHHHGYQQPHNYHSSNLSNENFHGDGPPPTGTPPLFERMHREEHQMMGSQVRGGAQRRVLFANNRFLSRF